MFAVLHVLDFPLQAVLRLEREQTARAVALIDDTCRPPLVIACTAVATDAGVNSTPCSGELPGRPSCSPPMAFRRCRRSLIHRMRFAQPPTRRRAHRAASAISTIACSGSLQCSLTDWMSMQGDSARNPGAVGDAGTTVRQG